jgi:hypothetical protein
MKQARAQDLPVDHSGPQQINIPKEKTGRQKFFA